MVPSSQRFAGAVIVDLHRPGWRCSDHAQGARSLSNQRATPRIALATAISGATPAFLADNAAGFQGRGGNDRSASNGQNGYRMTVASQHGFNVISTSNHTCILAFHFVLRRLPTSDYGRAGSGDFHRMQVHMHITYAHIDTAAPVAVSARCSPPKTLGLFSGREHRLFSNSAHALLSSPADFI